MARSGPGISPRRLVEWAIDSISLFLWRSVMRATKMIVDSASRREGVGTDAPKRSMVGKLGDVFLFVCVAKKIRRSPRERWGDDHWPSLLGAVRRGVELDILCNEFLRQRV